MPWLKNRQCSYLFQLIYFIKEGTINKLVAIGIDFIKIFSMLDPQRLGNINTSLEGTTDNVHKLPMFKDDFDCSVVPCSYKHQTFCKEFHK